MSEAKAMVLQKDQTRMVVTVHRKKRDPRLVWRGYERGSYMTKLPRLYVHMLGESVLDNLVHRRHRPHRDYRKHLLPLVLQAIPELAGAKFTWRQLAGCFCPCSPGFVIGNSPLQSEDVFVDVEIQSDDGAPA